MSKLLSPLFAIFRLSMIKRQYLKHPLPPSPPSSFQLTFYKASPTRTPSNSQSSGGSLNHPQTQRKEMSFNKEAPRFYTEAIHFDQQDAHSNHKLSHQRFSLKLPSILAHDCHNKDEWMIRLRAKMEVKRIYAEQRAIVQEQMACWKRVQARARVLQEIKREKMRLISMYNRQ